MDRLKEFLDWHCENPHNVNFKMIVGKEDREETKRMEKIAKSKAQVEESNRYYNADAKPGSLAAKANMVAKYNEKHEKGGKK